VRLPQPPAPAPPAAAPVPKKDNSVVFRRELFPSSFIYNQRIL
jgi:hypothetical protein